ncbi:hypothetical protein SteCoe_31425 [Stentor coeruleus]|uniref:Uncharacterized protein n=1 Tax=Stentor coeruleus TaxID=5963 RepID=A0A1R2B1S2_9CILI|nr:hypothetical protein SteCoe_31425 [Stentor coeruleus]
MSKRVVISFETKLNSGKNSNQSPKEVSLALPPLREGACQTIPEKHFFIAEDKQLPSKQKNSNGKLCSSVSPVSNDSINKGCKFSNWTSSCKHEKPSKIHEPKIKKTNIPCSEISRLHDKIDSPSLSPHEREKVKTFSMLCDTDEKLSIHQKALNAENLDSVFEKNVKELEIADNEINQTHIKEIISFLKLEISILNKKYTKLDEVYCMDTNILKKKIESQKNKYKQLEIDYKNICEKYEKDNNRYDYLLKKMHDTEKNYKTEIDNYVNKINELNEKSKCTNLEFINTVEYMQKIKSDRKEKEEDDREKDEKIESLIEYNNGLKTQITNLSNVLKNTLMELGEAKKDIELLEIETKELKDSKRDYLALEEKLKFMMINLDFANTNYKELQQSFILFKEKATVTESSLRLKIEKLSPTSPINSSTQSNERSKLRRFSTQATKITENLSQESLQKFSNERSKLRFSTQATKITENLSQESLQKFFKKASNLDDELSNLRHELFKKASNLDDELSNLRHELEKSNKDLAYSRKQLDEKNSLISQIEFKNSDTMAKSIEEADKASILKFVKFLNKQKKITENAFFLIECEECENQIVSSMHMPCENSFQCKKNILTEKNCAKCRGALKKAELSIMTEVIKSFKQKYANEDLALAKTIDQVIGY